MSYDINRLKFLPVSSVRREAWEFLQEREPHLAAIVLELRKRGMEPKLVKFEVNDEDRDD